MKLGVLCQSPVSDSMTAARAIKNTVDLARKTESFGYDRFWVAEHHSDRALASGAPEVLVAHLASVTQSMKIGAGGVLLPHHAPFHTAEQFNVLAALHPGRIELGMGRAGGSEAGAPAALHSRFGRADQGKDVDELLGYLGWPTKAKHTLSGTFASPRLQAGCQPWVLGTSPASAQLAGERGLPYAFGGFLDPRHMDAALALYRSSFRPSATLKEPWVNIAWYVQAAPTTDEAKYLTRSVEAWFVDAYFRGKNTPFKHPGEVVESDRGPMEQMAVAFRRQVCCVGTGEEVAKGLGALADATGADELTLVTITHDHAARVRSYQLVAKAWDALSG